LKKRIKYRTIIAVEEEAISVLMLKNDGCIDSKADFLMKRSWLKKEEYWGG
jgi:hypothetical protein